MLTDVKLRLMSWNRQEPKNKKPQLFRSWGLKSGSVLVFYGTCREFSPTATM